METTANAPAGARPPVTVRLVGGPAALIEIGGLRLLTDPVLDAPGLIAGSTRSPARTGGPGAAVKGADTIHAVLLSHDGHAGKPDGALRGRLAAAPMTLTTTEAAGRLGDNATAQPPWYHLTLDRPDGGCVKVTGTPARHGPKTAPTTTSLVTGFALTGPDVPTIYVSGDNSTSTPGGHHEHH